MMNEPSRPRGFVVLAIILTIFALGTIAFWIEFFTSGAMSMSDSPAYLEHEQSFPLLFGLMAGSGIVFLGLMDILYSIQQGMFNPFSASAAQVLFICAICLILGPVTITYLWRNRERLLG